MAENTNFKLGELFCGPGGLAWGALHAGPVISKEGRFEIVHAWANDYDKDTCETYRANICPDDPMSCVCEDVHKLDIESLGEIDALAFGFPCNDFSAVGARQGLDGTFGPLYTYGVRALKHYQPQWFLAENVDGLRTANSGKAFGQILNDLEGAGYRIYPNLYSFEEYGVPQTRHRVIIIGIRNDLKDANGNDLEFKIPAPTHEFRTCRDAIENPPIGEDVKNNEPPIMKELTVERLKYIKAGQNVWQADLPEELKIKTKTTISTIYRRLDPDKPSYTVTGSGGGGTRIYHWSENRALTNRERARIQTFPDEFEFLGGVEDVRRQVGMAVPPQGAQVIFNAVLKTFAGISYSSVSSNIDLEKIKRG